MTWNELKKAIDERLTVKGISHDTEVWYVDVSFPDEDCGLNVFTDRLTKNINGEYTSLGIAIDN